MTTISQPLETIEVDAPEVACDGGRLGHPRVFLRLDHAKGEAVCPYCSRTFLYKEAHAKA